MWPVSRKSDGYQPNATFHNCHYAVPEMRQTSFANRCEDSQLDCPNRPTGTLDPARILASRKRDTRFRRCLLAMQSALAVRHDPALIGLRRDDRYLDHLHQHPVRTPSGPPASWAQSHRNSAGRRQRQPGEACVDVGRRTRSAPTADAATPS